MHFRYTFFSEFTVADSRELEACIGSNVTLEWEYDLQGKSLQGLQWYFESTQVMSQMFWDPSPVLSNGYFARVQWIPPASYILLNAGLSDSGSYSCNVLISTAATTISNTMRLTVRGKKVTQFIFIS
jgi:hypothetical protein